MSLSNLGQITEISLIVVSFSEIDDNDKYKIILSIEL